MELNKRKKIDTFFKSMSLALSSSSRDVFVLMESCKSCDIFLITSSFCLTKNHHFKSLNKVFILHNLYMEVGNQIIVLFYFVY